MSLFCFYYKKHEIKYIFLIHMSYFKYYSYFCKRIDDVNPRHIVLNSFTITTVSKEQQLILGMHPNTGADFPYLVVVCGEP